MSELSEPGLQSGPCALDHVMHSPADQMTKYNYPRVLFPTMIPEIDCKVGLCCYSTDFPGCGGRIRESPGDFRVSEVVSSRTESQIHDTGDYPIYRLTKTGIDTPHALLHLRHKTGLRLRALGLKDSNAITTQYVYSNTKSAGLKEFKTDMYSLTLLGYTQKPISKKHMIANKFEIRISKNALPVPLISQGQRFLNFYGYQRFGSSRPVTHLIGKALVQKKYDDAVRYILYYESEYDSARNNQIRARMADPSNFASLLGEIPARMDMERRVISALLNDNDAFGAIRTLPVDMRRFYVQAYQSYIFNLTVSRAFEYGEDLLVPQAGDICYDSKGVLGKQMDGLDQRLAIPMVGYSYYKKTRFHFYISRILKEEGVSPGDFYIKPMQEASSEGGFRHATIRLEDFSIRDNLASFTLSRGSFATIVLRELIKPTDPLSSGF